MSLGPRAARFARYKAGKGQSRASMTANRPLSPTRRAPPRMHAAWGPASHGAQNTQPPCGRLGTSEPAQVHTSSPDVRPTPDSRVEESARSPARRPPVGAPEHEGHPATFSLPPPKDCPILDQAGLARPYRRPALGPKKPQTAKWARPPRWRSQTGTGSGAVAEETSAPPSAAP